MAPQAGISIWGEFRVGGKFNSQIWLVPELLLLDEFLVGAIFASHTF